MRDPAVLNVRLGDESIAEMLDVVLTYESTARGLYRGQTVFDLVTSGVDADSYPQQVRERLEQLERGRLDRAVRDSLAVPRRGEAA